MALTIITKNSTVASKRPTPAQLVTGELGLNLESTDPGLYFEDSAGNIRKVGGCHYGATAPNDTAAGEAGNSVGELWYDTADQKLKVWDGAAWTIAGGTDTQAFYLAGPWATGTDRPDGTPLLAGDQWYDTSTTPITNYVWDGAAWVAVSDDDTHAFYLAGPAWPYGANRPDGTVLVEGDRWYDTSSTPTLPYVWTGAAWVDEPLSVLAMPTGPVKTDKTTQELFYYNENTVDLDYTVLTTANAMSAGPITISAGVTVTVPVGAYWSIL